MATAQDLEAAIRVILATAKLEDVTQRTLREQLESQFGCGLTEQKNIIKEITIRVLVEREEEIAAQETQEKAATKAAIKREVDLVPQHSSDDESHDDNSSESDKEIGEIKPKMKKAKREVEEGKEEEDMPVAKKKAGGYNKEQAWSEEMTAFLGRGYMSRPQVTKHVWDYIKEKDLQNPADRRVILCDPVLKSLFGGVEKINMFKMPKAINKHVRHDDREKEEDEDDEDDGENEFDSDDEGDSRKRKASSAAKAKTEKNKKKAAAAATSVRTKTNVKKEDRNGAPAKQGGGRGFPQEKISKELQALIGKETASRNEVVKKLWEHIKANDMQDPSNRMNILCDETFKRILGVDSCHGFKMNKLLAPHFLGRA
ncbi:hypothetical protein VYU27_002361 [Nannochloropsis oceanica]